MRRLTPQERSQIHALVKRGISLNKISERLSLSKSTVYYWFRKLSGKRLSKVILDESDPELCGEFIGAFAGDGNLYLDRNYKYQCRLFVNIKDTKYAEHLYKLMTSLCSKRPWVYRNKASNVIIIRMLSKTLFLFVRNYLSSGRNKTKTVRLTTKTHCNKFATGFLRGEFDADGYLDKHGKRAIYSTISQGLASDIGFFLNRAHIAYRVTAYQPKEASKNKIFRIVVTKDLQRFIQLIKPYNASVV